MRLLKSEITGRDREQIGCITRLSLPSPTHRSDVKLAAQTSPSLEKQTTLQRWTLLLCGFWSPESSWQCDIKAASRLLLAANYIKQPRGFSVSESESTPAFFSIFSNFFKARVFFGNSWWDARRRCWRPTPAFKKKRTSRTRLTAKQRVRGRGLTRAFGQETEVTVTGWFCRGASAFMSWQIHEPSNECNWVIFEDWPSSARLFSLSSCCANIVFTVFVLQDIKNTLK